MRCLRCNGYMLNDYGVVSCFACGREAPLSELAIADIQERMEEVAPRGGGSRRRQPSYKGITL